MLSTCRKDSDTEYRTGEAYSPFSSLAILYKIALSRARRHLESWLHGSVVYTYVAVLCGGERKKNEKEEKRKGRKGKKGEMGAGRVERGGISGAGGVLVSAANLGVEVGCLQPLCKGFCALFGAQDLAGGAWAPWVAPCSPTFPAVVEVCCCLWLSA